MTTLKKQAPEPPTGGSSPRANAPTQVPGRRVRKLLFVLLAATSLSGPVAAQDEFSAVYVMSDNLGDMGFNDNAKTGFDRAEAEAKSRGHL